MRGSGFKSSSFFLKWIKIHILNPEKHHKSRVLWVLPKKRIPSAVLRNRFKRWGRNDLRQAQWGLPILVVLTEKDKNFYKNLKRQDFSSVFLKLLEKIRHHQPPFL